MSNRKHYWTWPIAIYLFLGGMGGGMLLASGIFDNVFDLEPGMFAMTALIACVLLGVGCLLLLFELGQMTKSIYLLKSSTAIIKWGAVLLVMAMLFGFIYFTSFLEFLPWYMSEGVIRVTSVLMALFGLAVMVYTGVLLASFEARPFWNTPLLPILFTTSAFSTGVVGLNFTAGLWPFSGSEGSLIPLLEFAHNLDIVVIAIEIAILLIYVLMMYASGNIWASATAKKWISGSFAFAFWGALLGVGLVVPALLYFTGNATAATIAGILALAGGLLLRFMVVFSDTRTEIPGEDRYYRRIAQGDESFLKANWE